MLILELLISLHILLLSLLLRQSSLDDFLPCPVLIFSLINKIVRSYSLRFVKVGSDVGREEVYLELESTWLLLGSEVGTAGYFGPTIELQKITY
jgi:hypothetical protein